MQRARFWKPLNSGDRIEHLETVHCKTGKNNIILTISPIKVQLANQQAFLE